MSLPEDPPYLTSKDPASGKSGHAAGSVTRRGFLGSLTSAGIAATATPLLHAGAFTPEVISVATEAVRAEGTIAVTLKINGESRHLQIEPRVTLLDALRENLGLFGTKKGCDHGQCGACTVHVNGRRVNSCLSLALAHDGHEITTIEGLGMPDALHPMQAAFLACDAYQCGYCTSGQIMSAVALLKEPCGPDDASVKELMSGNICRCGAYANIVSAIQQVRRSH